MMKFHVLTLFPEMIEQGLTPSIIGRAVEKNIIALNAVDIRSYTRERHGKVDDYPYGGGAGMLMQAQPVYDAHLAVTEGRAVRTIYVTPQGRPFDQILAMELAGEEELVLLCGHYEGIDQRVLEEVVTDYVSIGDYILTGGELAAMVIIDAVARLIPGVLGNETSAKEESFHNDLLEYPQYSRPEEWHGKRVPGVLLSGNHKEVEKWRLEQSLSLTERVRPDLYQKYLEKRQLIKFLSKDKRNNIHMMECLSRGLGRICYANDGDVLIYQQEGKICMINAATPESGKMLIENLLNVDRQSVPGDLKLYTERTHSCPKEVELILTSQGFLKDILEENGYSTLFSCHQFLYTEKAPLTVPHKDIRRLNMESFSYVCSHYDMCQAEYVRERILSGVMYGAFSEDRLVGFIGIHSEGSLGMLYVEESYRRQGIASSLEAYLVNRMLEQGFTPFTQVKEDNEESVCLQEKLGFYRASNLFWWLEKEGH